MELNIKGFGKARRRVQMRSALLLTLGVCFVVSQYRGLSMLSGAALFWPTHVFGLLMEMLVTLLAFGGGAYLGLCVLDGDHRKIVPRRRLSRAQVLWLLLLGVLLAAPMTLGADMLNAIRSVHRLDVQPQGMTLHAPNVFLLTIIKSALLVPVLEELFFRGYLLGALERFGTSRAALVSALCFALVHMSGHAWYICLLYAAMGMLLAALQMHTGSLLAPVLVHAGYNLALILLSHMGFGRLFEGLTLISCALRLFLSAAFVYCLRRAWQARRVQADMKPMQRLNKKEAALVLAAAVLALAASILG